MTAIPLDPMDLDRIPPPDADVCPTCAGRGIVILAFDPADPASEVDDDCPTCQGTGRLQGVA